jgi:O-antigen/teichoic acid export membrane protein
MRLYDIVAASRSVAETSARLDKIGHLAACLGRAEPADIEIAVALLLVVAAVAGVLLVAPIVFHTILHDKYPIGWSLIGVTVAVGVVRVAEGFSTTAVTALGTARALARISAMGWVSLAVAIVGAILGSRAGLVGIVSGTLLGWLTLCVSGCVLAVKSFHQRFPAELSPGAVH